MLNIIELDRPMMLRDLPPACAPIIDYLDLYKPEIVMACDRGARLGALCVYWSWKMQFPDVQFPSADKSIHFANFSKNTIEPERTLLQTTNLFARPVSILMLDDWVNTGETVTRFTSAAINIGFAATCIHMATLCGPKPNWPNSVVGLANRMTVNSIWNAYEEMAGIQCYPDQPTRSLCSADAIAARQKLLAMTSAYYAKGGGPLGVAPPIAVDQG